MKKEFKVICNNCNKEFFVTEDESKFPSETKYFCSRKCANTRQLTAETKEKISQGLKAYNIKIY